ncbi:MAG: UDP-N-acetylmuramoyl-L-alanyl-D-glutamate--2,6-diaminopimelate ligase [Myxococcota bacterium]
MRHEGGLAMTLSDLQQSGVGGQLIGSGRQVLTGVKHDSRAVEAGDLFVAIGGAKHDGAKFVGDALGRGAVAVIAERALDDVDAQLVVDDARLALGRAAELVYGNPTSRLPTLGVTGTNGKTTIAYLVARAVEAAGAVPAVIGTTGLFVGSDQYESAHTTPEGDDIARFAKRAVEEGATHLVAEVSSHGLDLRRVDAVDFDVAAFTNLSRDHLDYHGTVEAYGEAKARLFTELGPRVSVIHIDDAFGAELAGRASGTVVGCSRRDATAEVFATEWSATRDGVRARVRTASGSWELESPMLGEHNLENLLVAMGCVEALGVDLGDALSSWADAPGSPGRLERVPHPRDVAVLVDYAHTPDALRRVLEALRELTPGRLMVVFGAGGDRDRGKRPEMGRVAATTADLCVVTSDNPRTEDPKAIIEEVVAGISESSLPGVAFDALAKVERGYLAEVDRARAIATAIGAARDGDTVLIAGKGHEDYQIVGSTRHRFDDREEAARIITSLEELG